MQAAQEFIDVVKRDTGGPNPVVAFDSKEDKLLRMDFTEQATELTQDILANTEAFSQYIRFKLQNANAKYGIGGYAEHRTIYSRSELFGARCIHLGMDIWGEAGTTVYAPLEATVHSFGFNDAFGDYGTTIILQHQIDGCRFYSLYGHLNFYALQTLKEGQKIARGQQIAAFGTPSENGHWPPHLHFQIILDLQGYKGDYPGVCSVAEREHYLANCPDPDLLLGMMTFAKQD